MFLCSATLFLLLFGWLSVAEVVPINLELSTAPLSPWAAQFFGWWIRVAMVLGLIVPLVVFLFFIRSSDVRMTFGLYLFVLVFQIGTEITLTLVYFSAMAVPIGTIYTAYRLWQLLQSWQVIHQTTQLTATSRKLIQGLLGVLFAFWLTNLIFVLIILEWPRLL